MKREHRLIVALDCHVQKAKEVIRRLAGLEVKYKVGNWMLLEPDGRALVWQLLMADYSIMLDLKLFDHPNTVREVTKVAREMGFWAMTIHAQDRRVMEAALKGRANGPMKLLGVTVLSSQTPEDLNEQACYEITHDVDDVIRHRTAKVVRAGFDGVVCPATNVDAAKDVVSQMSVPEFMIVTPGIRDVYVKGHDQHRETVAPSYAMGHGSTHIVVGRPIVNAMDPLIKAMDFINDMIGDEKAG